MVITYEKSSYVDIAVFEKAKQGNACCGDANTVIHTEEYTVCAVIDGLGSGERAYESASAAVKAIQANHQKSVDQIVTACNKEMLFKRGIVLTVIKITHSSREVCYCNVGNISFVLYNPSGTTIQPVPTRGYLSGKKGMFRSHTFTYEQDSVLALYSDGVTIPPSKNKLLNLTSLDQSAEALFSEINYEIDDVTLLLGKLK